MKITKLLFLFLFMTVVFNSILFAAYLTYQPITLKQPDGTSLNLFASGDEFYNWVHDKDGYTIMRDSKGWLVYAQKMGNDIAPSSLVVGQDNPSSRGITPNVNKSPEEIGRIRDAGYQRSMIGGGGRAPHSGTLNNIVIFIRFSDQSEFTDPITTYSSMFNGTTGNTMQNYFGEASYNQLNVSTTFYPAPSTTVLSYQDSHPRAYYSPYDATTNPTGYTSANSTLREHTLLVSATNAVSSGVPTGLNIDGDNNGQVDNVCFIIQGNSDGWAELLWPHRWSLYSQFVYINGKRVYDYNFQLSLFMASRGVGVLCHEMFHSLGAPDLYHYTTQPVSPVGGWDIMEADQNPPQHMGAYMKFKYGLWISSIPVISTPGTYTLNSLATSTNNCYRINSPNAGQYFVLEYRKKTGTFESSVPGSGLLVYRINTAASGNSGGPPDEVYIYRPNGTTTVNGDLNTAFFSDEAGRIIINNYTNPKPYLYDESNGNLNLSAIGSSAGNSISFTYSTSDPLLSVNENFENGFTTLPWYFSGNANWTLDTTQYYNGIQSAKSGVIGNSQSSVMQLNVTTLAGQVSFFYKVSSEANYDYLKFYIDGVLKNQWSGEASWGMVAFNITMGSHTLKWEYMKDGSTVAGSDCAWVDYIAYPAAVMNPAQNLKAIASNGFVTLNWQAPTSGTPTGYKIYRNSSYLTTQTGLSYQDNSVVNGTTYSYYVTAAYANPVGESVPTNIVSATPMYTITLSIGSETTASRRPISTYYGYERSANLFLDTEVPIHGTVNNLAWYPTVATTAAIPTKIYMKTITAGSLTSDTWANMITGATLVYDASIPAPTINTWLNLDITDFPYSSGNLLVLTECNYGATGTGISSGSGFLYSLSGTNLVQTWQQDTTIPTGNGALSNQRPNIQLTMGNIATTPSFSVTPSSIDFGMVMLNTQSAARTITIFNSGVGSLTISSITKTGLNLGLYILTDTNTYPKVLTSGQSMSVTVILNAVATGVKTATIRITDTQAKQVHDVVMTGTGVDATITSYPYSEGFETGAFPFGWQNVPISPSTQAFDYQATGTYPTCTPHTGNYMVRYNSYNIASGNAAYISTPPLKMILNKNFRVKFWMYRDVGYPSSADSMNVYFSNTQTLTAATLLGTIYRQIALSPVVSADGWYEYSFDFPINQGTNKRYVLLQGGSKYGNNIFIDDLTVEEAPLIAIFSINHTDLDFGCVNLGSSNTLQFSITNSGNTPLTGSITTSAELAVSIAARSEKSPVTRNVLAYSVPAGSSNTFNLQYSPSTAGQVNANITVTSNDANHPSNLIHIAGIGFAAPETQTTPITTNNELGWSPVVGATAYGVYRADTPNGIYELITTVTSTSYVIPMTARVGFYRITAISDLPKSGFNSTKTK